MTERMTTAALGLGANQGPCRATLRRAVDALSAVVDGLRVGGLYRSAPEAAGPQPDYWNTAVVGRTRLGPEELLAFGKALERAAGRRPGLRNAPRPLDIDLLVWGELVREAPELTLPHPRLARRAFVLAPLADAAGELRIPPGGRTVAELLATVDRGSLRRVPWRPEG
jgi:2-amino-4-hydroxy-6-hydroxymethyldihydropteridine diphosphokinase